MMRSDAKADLRSNQDRHVNDMGGEGGNKSKPPSSSSASSGAGYTALPQYPVSGPRITARHATDDARQRAIEHNKLHGGENQRDKDGMKLVRLEPEQALPTLFQVGHPKLTPAQA